MQEQKVYADYAAATPLDRRVLKAMLPFLKENFGNPSSIHSLGVLARRAVEQARGEVSKVLHAHQDEIVFTSGATESINLAIRGVLGSGTGHVVTLASEHQAVLSSVGENVTYVPVGPDGAVRVDDVLAAIRPDTVLVTIMMANNEIGVIQPIADIGREIVRRRKEQGSLFPFFHTDATQAANYLELDVERLHVDLLSLSGSKIYGPKGSGVLYVRRGVKIEPLVVGGKQELRMRAGTEHVAGIVGFAAALTLASMLREREEKRSRTLRDVCAKKLMRAIPGATLNSVLLHSLPNILNFSIPGIEGEELVLRLDAQGIYISTASACKGGNEPSHVLAALGKTKEEVMGSVRLSFGRQTRRRDIARIVEVLPKLVAQMRG